MSSNPKERGGWGDLSRETILHTVFAGSLQGFLVNPGNLATWNTGKKNQKQKKTVNKNRQLSGIQNKKG